MGRTALFSALSLTLLCGCDKVLDDRPKDKIAAADQKAKSGAYNDAIKLYESALTGTAETADVNYRLAVIYDEKVKRPASALHYFQRYLEFSPRGPFADEARSFVRDAQKKLGAGIGGSGPASQAELVRLKNQNLDLQKQLTEAKQRMAALSVAAARKVDNIKAPLPPGARKHMVQSGETLASISQKYYGTRNRAQDIQDANFNQLGGKNLIRPGQTLIIP